MNRVLTLLVAVAAVAAGPAAKAQQALVLSCKGTVEGSDAKPDPVSMAIIINFATRTVQGFENLGSLGFDPQAKIVGANDVQFSFEGSHQGASIFGHMDRVTGKLWATATLKAGEGSAIISVYDLQCIRMF